MKGIFLCSYRFLPILSDADGANPEGVGIGASAGLDQVLLCEARDHCSCRCLQPLLLLSRVAGAECAR